MVMYSLLRNSLILGGLSAISGYLIYRGAARLYRRGCTTGICKLIIYPIKSLAGIEVDHLKVTATGVMHGVFHDRSYILLNEHNNMITQRTKPKLSLIRTAIHGEQLWLDAPGMATLKIHYRTDTSEQVEFQVWKQDVKGVDCGQEANDWFSQYLGAPTKLVRFVAGMEHRSTSVERDNQVLLDAQYPIVYQDGAPCLLINQCSIDDLNCKLERSSQVTYRNFRPNILIRHGEAFSEDTWKDIQIGPVRYNNCKPCTRCTFTTVIPEKGVKHQNGEPLRTLRQYRVNPQLKHLYQDSPLFGVNLIAYNEGSISLSDAFSLIQS